MNLTATVFERGVQRPAVAAARRASSLTHEPEPCIALASRKLARVCGSRRTRHRIPSIAYIVYDAFRVGQPKQRKSHKKCSLVLCPCCSLSCCRPKSCSPADAHDGCSDADPRRARSLRPAGRFRAGAVCRDPQEARAIVGRDRRGQGAVRVFSPRRRRKRRAAPEKVARILAFGAFGGSGDSLVDATVSIVNRDGAVVVRAQLAQGELPECGAERRERVGQAPPGQVGKSSARAPVRAFPRAYCRAGQLEEAGLHSAPAPPSLNQVHGEPSPPTFNWSGLVVRGGSTGWKIAGIQPLLRRESGSLGSRREYWCCWSGSSLSSRQSWRDDKEGRANSTNTPDVNQANLTPSQQVENSRNLRDLRLHRGPLVR